MGGLTLDQVVIEYKLSLIDGTKRWVCVIMIICVIHLNSGILYTSYIFVLHIHLNRFAQITTYARTDWDSVELAFGCCTQIVLDTYYKGWNTGLSALLLI